MRSVDDVCMCVCVWGLISNLTVSTLNSGNGLLSSFGSVRFGSAMYPVLVVALVVQSMCVCRLFQFFVAAIVANWMYIVPAWYNIHIHIHTHTHSQSQLMSEYSWDASYLPFSHSHCRRHLSFTFSCFESRVSTTHANIPLVSAVWLPTNHQHPTIAPSSSYIGTLKARARKETKVCFISFQRVHFVTSHRIYWQLI